MNDLVKCSRCRKTLIAESFRDHDCSSTYRDVKTIIIDFHTKTKDEFGREMILAKTMDGTMLRLVMNESDSIPIPFEPIKRKFTGDETKRGFDTTFWWVLYHNRHISRL